MGRVYTASFTAVAVTAAVDFFELTAPATGMFRLLSVRIGQSTEEADAQAEMLNINIVRYATSGTGGGTATPIPHQVGHAASGDVTVETNNTTQGGTPTVIVSDSWNVQIGWLYQPAPEEAIWVPPSGILAIESPDTPADSISFSGSLTYEELD